MRNPLRELLARTSGGLAVRKGTRLGLSEGQGGEHGKCRPTQGNQGQNRLFPTPFVLHGGGEFIEGERAFKREVADACSPQRGEVSADPQGRARIAREGPYVGARRTLDSHVDIDDANRPGNACTLPDHGLVEANLRYARGRKNLQARDAHRARRQLDVLPRAGERIRSFTVHLDRRHCRGNLHDVTAQGRERRLQVGLAEGGTPHR